MTGTGKGMEILAPAGNREALERARAAGADAVYLGFSAFSARAGAGNFDEQELCSAIRYAHFYRMRVYVTVNTLVKDAELPQVLEVLRMLSGAGADGVLVQDAGVLRLARKYCPGLRIHASTQMAVHNAAGVRWCAAKGMQRVVLARECSLEEIRLCAQEGPEIEVFGHGAQCVAVSGLCLFSSMLGERSGNRGRCAQPCRMMYRFDGKKGAFLSPRDVCVRDDLPELSRSGAASLKIEGRLKRPEYVSVVTESYRGGMDSLEAGAFEPAGEKEKEALAQIFNRGGFMRGYAFGCEDAGVIDPAGVNHRGLEIGTVESSSGGLARARVTKALHDGDTLCFRRAAAGEDRTLTYSGREVPPGGTAVIRLREGIRPAKGDAVFRLTDAAQMERARSLKGKPVYADLFLTALPGKGMTLTATDGENTVTAAGDTAEAARNRETTKEELEKQLAKTGGTLFEARRVRAETGGAFVPLGAVNALRREALNALAEARIAGWPPEERESAEEMPAVPRRPGKLPLPGLIVTARTEEQADAARRREGVLLIRDPEDFRPEALEKTLEGMRPGEWLRLPEVCEEGTLEMIRGLAGKYAGKLGGVLLGSIGQLGLEWPVPVAAGPGVPVMNREAAALLFEEGCVFVTASPELSGSERKLLVSGEERIVRPVYGRTQLMLLHHCPARTALGLSAGRKDCRLCDAGDPGALRGKKLEDRMGYAFPLERLRLPEGCLVRLLNALPTDVLDRARAVSRAVVLTEESAEEAERVLRAAERGEKTGMEATRGHWNRPVE